MKSKVTTAQEAVRNVRDGATVMVGGFMACGTPEVLIDALVEKNVRDLTIICNDAGGAEWIPGKRSKMLDMTVYDEESLRGLLFETGFSNVKIYIETDGRICAIAEK